MCNRFLKINYNRKYSCANHAITIKLNKKLIINNLIDTNLNQNLNNLNINQINLDLEILTPILIIKGPILFLKITIIK